MAGTYFGSATTNISPAASEIKGRLSKEEAKGTIGLGYENPIHVMAPSDKAIQGAVNASMHIGLHRTGGIKEMSKDPNTASLYLVAGTNQAVKNKAPHDSNDNIQLTNRNLSADASNLFLTARSPKGIFDDYRLDNMMAAANGGSASTKNTAGIGLASDVIAICARAGSVKIVSSAGHVASNGVEVGGKSGIELIGNNDARGLQPIPVGNNLIAAMSSLCNILSGVTGTLGVLASHQNEMAQVVADHDHFDLLLMLIGALGLGSPTAIANGKVPPNGQVSAICKKVSSFITSNVLPAVETHKGNCEGFHQKYLAESGIKYINSELNMTT